MRKTILQEQHTCSVQKTARKSTKYWRKKTILKIDPIAKAIAHAKALAFAKWSLGSKIENAKNIRKTILQQQHSCPV